MASYSPLLRFVEPANGDLGWGGTINNGFTELADAAIAGTASVDVTASDVTLSPADGAADDARKMVLRIYGSPGAARTVNVPSTSKIYFVKNECGQTATVKVSGQTGVAVPNAASMVLRVNGTDVVQAVDTLGSPALTGTPTAPTAAYGTNTTQIATTAFVQAALQALHPVGSIYINATNATNPGTLFGFGTWTAFGAGRVPVGFDAGNALFDTAEETGGSADAIVVSHTHTATSTFTGSALGTHTHSITDPGHSHGIPDTQNTGSTFPNNCTSSQTSAAISSTTATTGISISAASAGTPTGTVATTVASAGSSGTNANYQPYITVYMWKRTA